ncbi:FtsW/RodA/SpoVE family cell cycle protein [Gorillibacterium sp. sgz5001074]|uniref:FtsW/RodA/SpoVE family cell cycle protein n=1 Tax=Gorillibacterium sp. sgz5001074 TaxID=3446695 RepID=UPI003F678821
MLEKWKKIDWSIVLILVLMTIISCMLVFSATVDNPKYGHDFYKKIYVNAAVGFVAFFGVTFMDFRLIIKTSLFSYVFGILLLVALFFWGIEREGAKGWFETPMGDFQPAELMKVILIIAVAAYMGRRQGERLELLRDVVPIGLIVLLPFTLVLIQPDMGNAMIFLVILLGLYWIGNIKYTHVLIGTTIVVVFIAGFFYVFKTYHDDIQVYAKSHGFGHMVGRIDTFINPEAVDPNKSYQYIRSKIAIGSGMLRGDGYLKGNSVHNNFVPVAYTDGIFVVVAEEFGFIGSSALLLLYFILIYRMILISIQSHDLAGSYMIVGIVSMYVFQIFQNIGMFIGLMPLTGITLPFVSYGGTSLLINMLSMGLVMSVRLHQEKESMFGMDR